jgi:hypothetical protein
MENAADAKSVDRKRERAKADQRLRDQILRETMQTERGRRFIWLELEAHSVFRQTLVLHQGSDSFAATAFAEGKRSMGLRLIADVTRLDPAMYLLMTRENSGVTLEDEDERSTDAD